jgi:predicted Rossmann fold flavoprotein
MKIAVIGAGPAGMMAAIQAARAGAEVHLFDGNDMVGRKLLVTGSGRCNITNQGVSAGRYTCSNPAGLARLLLSYGEHDLIAFLEEIGVPTFSTSDGWFYPVSESAAAVTDAFAAALAEAGVVLHLGNKVGVILKIRNYFELKGQHSGEHIRFDACVVASGGKAYPTLGSTGELFSQVRAFGHTINPLYPALAPVLADVKAYLPLLGVRMDAAVRLYLGNQLQAETLGNLIFTQWGLNGPAVMDLSHHISQQAGAPFELSLNLIAGNEQKINKVIASKRQSSYPLKVVLQSVLSPKVSAFMIERAHLSADVMMKNVTDEKLKEIITGLSDIRLKVQGVRGFEYCQLSVGGVPFDEVEETTMQSKRVPGLFLAGEVLDVVGPCGGYNLQFAFSSGAAAGRAAGKMVQSNL